jgi:hypothetical protein
MASMNKISEAEARRRRDAAKRSFDVLELARRLDVFAEVAEKLYERYGRGVRPRIA